MQRQFVAAAARQSEEGGILDIPAFRGVSRGPGCFLGGERAAPSRPLPSNPGSIPRPEWGSRSRTAGTQEVTPCTSRSIVPLTPGVAAWSSPRSEEKKKEEKDTERQRQTQRSTYVPDTSPSATHQTTDNMKRKNSGWVGRPATVTTSSRDGIHQTTLPSLAQNLLRSPL